MTLALVLPRRSDGVPKQGAAGRLVCASLRNTVHVSELEGGCTTKWNWIGRNPKSRGLSGKSISSWWNLKFNGGFERFWLHGITDLPVYTGFKLLSSGLYAFYIFLPPTNEPFDTEPWTLWGGGHQGSNILFKWLADSGKNWLIDSDLWGMSPG